MVLPMRPEVLKGHLDALLLAVLEDGPRHGYAVIEALREGSDGALDLPTGTVYPALHRLERAGLIRSDWETVVRPQTPRLPAHRLRQTGTVRPTRGLGTVLHRRHRTTHEAPMASHHLTAGEPPVRRPRSTATSPNSPLGYSDHAPPALVCSPNSATGSPTRSTPTSPTACRPTPPPPAAIGEFGDPTTVAHSFDAELATAFARRTIATFILTGPLVGIWWLLLLHTAPWRTGVLATLIAIPALPLIALAIATAAGTFATTGRLMRWLPETSATRALAAAATIATLCLVGDLTVLGVLAVRLATGWHPSVSLMAVAATASLLRIAAAITVIRSTRAVRDLLRHM